MPSYDHLSKEELLRLIQARDRRDSTRFGIVWETNEIERDKALNADFVSLELDSQLSVGKAPWKNLVIEGDNFDALRYLRMTFAGEVKCIYIDPPYNTGNSDFVYNDRFVDKNDSWRHSTWTEFMFQRLVLAKELLKEDGAIFVSIDDNEFATLRLLMNKIFGEGNFLSNFIWRKVDSPNDNKGAVTPDHEYIVCFAMSAEAVDFLPMPAPQIVEAYGSVGPDGRRYRDRLLKKNGKNSLRRDRPTMYFAIKDPDGNDVFPIHDNGEEARWSMGPKGVADAIEEKSLIWKKRTKLGKEVWEPYTREWAPPDPTRPYPTIWSDLPTTRQAKAMLRQMFDSADVFSTPKPVELIERILRMATKPGDLIVDFFGGSGSTAHAVLRANSQDNGNRRFILVSNSEATADNPTKNICRDVCAKRIQKAIEGYADTPGLPGEFAYLKCKRVKAGSMLELEHAEIWTALQLIHFGELVDFTPAPFLTAGSDGQMLVYVPRLTPEMVPQIRETVKPCRSVVVYSWQPETLRQQVRYGHVLHESVPEGLALRFGIRAEG